MVFDGEMLVRHSVAINDAARRPDRVAETRDVAGVQQIVRRLSNGIADVVHDSSYLFVACTRSWFVVILGRAPASHNVNLRRALTPGLRIAARSPRFWRHFKKYQPAEMSFPSNIEYKLYVAFIIAFSNGRFGIRTVRMLLLYPRIYPVSINLLLTAQVLIGMSSRVI